MIPYKNLSGKSGVKAYEWGTTYIKIKFQDEEVYLYNHRKPGKLFVETMKELAAAGRGLSTFISKFVKENYAEKSA
jgi:hypothetical protein